MRTPENWLPALILLVVCCPAAILADGWVSTDSASQYGFSNARYPGEDSPPPPTSYTFSVAPDPQRHDMWFYDYGNNGQSGQPATDVVQDRRMRWTAEQIRTFNSHYEWNYVHQVIVDRNMYEADSYVSTNLEGFDQSDHNEDEAEWEEERDGYEEKEVGTLYPEFLDSNTDYYVYTHWKQLANGAGQFESQAELTEPGLTDDWHPRGQRSLGKMGYSVSNNSPSSVIWDFDTANNFEGWKPFKTSGAAVNNGILFIDPAGHDPYVEGPDIQASATYYKYVMLDMASNAQDGYGRIYFKTQSSNFYSDDKSVPFTVNHCPPSSCNGGAQFRDHTVNMAVNSKWAGTVTGIRVDPANDGRSGTNIDTIGFDSIRLSRHYYADSGEVDFELVAEQQSQTVTQGGVAQFRIRADFSDDFYGQVKDFAVLNPPPGTSVRFDPPTISASGGSTTLSVETSGSTPTGTSGLVVSAGSSNQFSSLVNVELTVNPPSAQVVNIIPNVRHNGQTWSGWIWLRISGPQGLVVDRQVLVPSETFAVPPGFYTIQYVSGGPAPASLSQVWAAQPCGATGSTSVSCNYTSASLNNSVFFDFSGSSPATYSISGRVTDAAGAGIGDLQVSVSGTETWYARTTSDGIYRFFNLPSGGSYTVAPSSSNYNFNPRAVKFDSLTADATANFTGTLRASPAGKIAFTRGYNESAEIWAINADGSGLTQLTRNSANDAYPTWSPDGSKIAFVSWRDGNKEIYVMNADGSNQRNLTNHYEYDLDPAWSPDGSKIAFYSYRDGNAEIYVMNEDGSNQTRLTYRAGMIDSEPAWSPDGTKIAFQSFQNFVVDIYAMNADGTNLRNLTNNNPGQSTVPAWSPNNDKIAFSRDGEIFVMNVDGSNQTNISLNPSGDYDPAWSPDGSSVAFISYRENQQDLYVMGADGSNQIRLTYTAEDDYDPAWQQRAGPAVISVTVGTNPAGLVYQVDGQSYNTTQTFGWEPGSSHSLSTPATQSGSGADTRYALAGWSDGGAISHTVSPSGSTTFIANFTTQYFLTTVARTGGAVSPASGWYNSGQSVSISATPNSGYSFGGWVGSGSGSYTGSANPGNVSVTGPITEVANFTSQPSCTSDNLALACAGAVASASSSYGPNYPASAVNDGDRRGLNWNAGGGWNDATPNSYPDWVQVDFGASRTVGEVGVFMLQDNTASPVEPGAATTFTQYGVTAFEVQYWNGAAWATVPNGSVTGNNLVWRRVSFPAVVTSKIRVVVNNALAGYSRLTEVEAYAAAPARPNVALASSGAVASASSSYNSNYPASAVNDGDRRGLNWNSGGGWNDATPNSYPDWVQINFSGNKRIDEISVYTLQDNPASPVEPDEGTTFSLYGITDFRVEYLNDYWGWMAVPNGVVTGNNRVKRAFSFPAVTTNKIRVLVNGALAGHSRVTEVEAFEARPNVASTSSGATATASSSYGPSYPASSVINGDRRGLNWNSGGGWNDATPNSYPDWVQVDFGVSRTVSEVNVFTLQDNTASPVEPSLSTAFSLYGVKSFEVQYWNGAAWATVPGGSVTGNSLVWRRVSFPPVTTSRIRVVVNGALAGYSRLTEIEAY